MKDKKVEWQPRLVSIKKGDWGKKFVPLNGEGDAYNRPLRKSRGKGIVRNWERIRLHTGVVLMPLPGETDKYWVVDGQHRIWAAADLLGRATTIWARVLDPSKAESSDMSEAIDTINGQQVSFRLKDNLNNTKAKSMWPDIFRILGREPAYTEKKYELTWPSISRAILYADQSLKGKRIGALTTRKGTVVEEVWLKKYPRAQALDRAKAVCWMYDVLDAQTDEVKKKVGHLYGYKAVAMSILAYTLNMNLRTLETRPNKLVVSPFTDDLKRLGSRAMSVYSAAWLKAINYRIVSRNTIMVFGNNGR
jgi:hypothetical protein